MKDLISLYREAVRDDWDKQTDATLANMQEAEQNLLSRLSAGEKAVKKVAELEQEMSKVVSYVCYKREMKAGMVKIAELEKQYAQAMDTVTKLQSERRNDALDGQSEMEVANHRIAELEKEVERLKATAVCIYCNKIMVADNGKDKLSMMIDHMALCDKHPMYNIGNLLVEIDRLKFDKRELVEALEAIRKVVVVACGDKAPYIKIALERLDAALAKHKEAL